MLILLLLAYPLLVHLAVIWDEPRLEWLALVVLCAIPQYRGLRAARPGHWLGLLGLAALLYGLTRAGGGIYALFLPSLLIPAMLTSAFAGSLRQGQVPLVTRIARLANAPLANDVIAYTRKVTVLWAWVMLAVTVSEAGLALLAPWSVWSLFSNFVNYLLVGLVFVLEYRYRCWRFPSHDHQGFRAHLRLVASFNYKSARSGA